MRIAQTCLSFFSNFSLKQFNIPFVRFLILSAQSIHQIYFSSTMLPFLFPVLSLISLLLPSPFINFVAYFLFYSLLPHSLTNHFSSFSTFHFFSFQPRRLHLSFWLTPLLFTHTLFSWFLKRKGIPPTLYPIILVYIKQIRCYFSFLLLVLFFLLTHFFINLSFCLTISTPFLFLSFFLFIYLTFSYAHVLFLSLFFLTFSLCFPRSHFLFSFYISFLRFFHNFILFFSIQSI